MVSDGITYWSMGQTYDDVGTAMGSTGTQAQHPATSDEMTAALNAALEAGDLETIMGIMGEMACAHRMRRVARETGLCWKSLHKSMRAGASPEFNTVLRVLRSLGFRLRVRHADRAVGVVQHQVLQSKGGGPFLHSQGADADAGIPESGPPTRWGKGLDHVIHCPGVDGPSDDFIPVLGGQEPPVTRQCPASCP